jgi:tape measure domain-containing protein
MSSKLQQISNKGKSTFGTINEKHERFNRNLDTSNRKLSTMQGGLSGVTSLAAKLGIAFSAFTVAGGIIKLGADLESTRISFETMLGSASKAKSLMDGLDDFANKTPFKNADLQKNANLLLNFGFAGNKVIPTLKMLGDVSGGNVEKFNSLSLAYAQVASTGKLMGQDLLQMINAGFNPLQIISEKTGRSMASLKDDMSKGKIGADMVEEAFRIATSEGGRFFNMMDKQSRSFNGKWSTFIGKLQLGASKFGLKVLPILSKFVDWGIQTLDFLPQIPAYFDAFTQVVSDNSIVIGLLTGSLIALNAQLIWGQLSFLAFTIQFKAYVLWTKIATAAQWLWNAALTANPIGLIVAGVLALAAAIVYAYNKIGWFRGGIKATWELMKGFGSALKEYVIDRITQMVKGITGIGQTLMHFFKGDWKKAWETGKEATKNLTGLGVGNGSKFAETMKASGKNAAVAYNKGIAEANANKKKGSFTDILKGKLTSSVAGGTAGVIDPEAVGGVGGLGDVLGKGISDITGGGQRQTNITVSFDKLVETFNVNTQTFEQGMDESLDSLKKMLLRVLNSANQMQTTPA